CRARVNAAVDRAQALGVQVADRVRQRLRLAAHKAGESLVKDFSVLNGDAQRLVLEKQVHNLRESSLPLVHSGLLAKADLQAAIEALEAQQDQLDAATSWKIVVVSTVLLQLEVEASFLQPGAVGHEELMGLLGSVSGAGEM